MHTRAHQYDGSHSAYNGGRGSFTWILCLTPTLTLPPVTLRKTVDAGIEGVARETRVRAEETETNLRTCETALRFVVDK